jgi:hypothetical protein
MLSCSGQVYKAICNRAAVGIQSCGRPRTTSIAHRVRLTRADLAIDGSIGR